MIYFIFSILIILVDRGVKLWIAASLEVGQSLNFIPGVLRIIHVENTGAAFSLFDNMRWPLVVVSSIAVVVLVLVILMYRDGNIGKLAASFMLGGAVGNLIDRIYSGKVVDMFDPVFIKFAVFNVADIFVTAGCIIFLCHLIYLAVEQGKLQKKEAVKSSVEKTTRENTAMEINDTESGAPVDESKITEQQILVDYYMENGLDERDN